MHISTRTLVIEDYRTAKDRGSIGLILSLHPESQTYVEATSDGLTFANSYLAPIFTLQICPPDGDEFGPSDVADIIGRSPSYFGIPSRIAGLASGRLSNGIVFECIDGDEPQVHLMSFAQLREEDLHQPV